MLLQAISSNKQISRFLVGNVSDLPEGRESLASALQQVERAERVLKSLWRERHQPKPGWIDVAGGKLTTYRLIGLMIAYEPSRKHESRTSPIISQHIQPPG